MSGRDGEAPLAGLEHGLRRRAARLGLAVALAAAGLTGLLASVPLTGAVVASGELAPAGQRRTVQHREGGIVAVLHVADGDRVEAGAPLVTLRAPDIEAEYRELQEDSLALQARIAHLQAARDDAPAPARPAGFPAAGSDPVADQFWAAELAALDRRRAVRDSQRAVLRARVDAVSARIAGSERQRDYLDRQIASLEKEADSVRALVKRSVAPKQRGWEIERTVLDLMAERDAAEAQIAQARVEGEEVEAERDRLEQEWTEAVQRDLLQALRDLGRTAHRLSARSDAMARLVVRAPVAGHVLDRQVHTVGGTVAPGDALMQVVPENEALVARARVATTDIDEIRGGAEAELQMLAFSQRAQHRLTGRVTEVGADRSTDPESGAAFYTVQIDIGDAAAALGPAAELRAGMPVEAAIITRPRTMLDYLLDPFRSALRRGMTEG